jgi:SAM-dependent methyltransferase
MLNSVERFSSRVENYVRYRPGYPDEIIELLTGAGCLTAESIVADIGSGTGFLTELFLKNGNKVFAVEPNAVMRAVAEKSLGHYENFVSLNGTAEATTLNSGSVNLITAAQAFHWFDQQLARAEFLRILRPAGCVVLVWNERRLETTPFLRDYEKFLMKFGSDYQDVRHENVQRDLRPFFAPDEFKVATVENFQVFDLAGLTGRVLSSSYAPQAGDQNFEAMNADLRELFHKHQQNGTVTVEYDTRLYYGQLSPRQTSTK